MLLLAPLLAVVACYAQQDPLQSQYINNLLLVNPAYAGATHDLNIVGIYRKQWAGFEGSPITSTANGHMSIMNHKVGVGLSMLSDKIGSNNTTELQGIYAYHLPLSEQVNLSFGLQGGMVNYKTDYSDLTINPDDPGFASISEWKPTFGAGLILKNEKILLSLSVPKMLKAETQIDSVSTSLYNQHFYGLGAYLIQFSPRIKIKPFALIRAVKNSPITTDLGVAMRVDDSYTLGVFTRNFDTYGLQAQLNVGDLLRFGYVFELPTNQSVGLNYTSHEIMVGFRIKAFLFHDLDAIQNF